ncbi:PTS glucose transporter subunit IIA, partial [[Ruminococcus] gnavus]|nr:PTS glucose transporter subunit IIA [Mediterraneibacter gnavus]
GLFDFIVFGVLQGNSKTSWVLLIPIGIIYFMLYYFSFKYLIKKFDLKTPGREIDNMKLSIFKNPKASHRKLLNKGIEIDKQSQLIVRGLGGRDN